MARWVMLVCVVSLGGCSDGVVSAGEEDGSVCEPDGEVRARPDAMAPVEDAMVRPDRDVPDQDVPDADVPEPIGFDQGLLALYTFDESLGSTVHDVSGVAPALDLQMYGSGVTRIASGVAFGLTDNPIVVSDGPATKILDAVKATDEISVELWLQATQLSQDGPARLFGLALRNHHRNLSILHGPAECGSHAAGSHYQIRVLNVGEDNGCDPIVMPATNANVTLDVTHLVFTQRSDGQQRLYLDGAVNVEDMDRDPNFDHWYDDVVLAFGNEPNGTANATRRDGGRRWQGRLFLAAVYDRALTEADVIARFTAGYETRAPSR
ncbi:MAG: LamG-like jellyroll fold domain-containing protein [Myxococcota bacterium]